MNYYQHNIGDYRRDTSHLTLLEHGVYRQLIDSYYLAEQEIPLETEVVFRRLCAKTEEEKSAVETILSEFFIRTEIGWVHKRCEAEITAYQAKAGRARDNGKLGGRPRKTDEVISGNQEKTGSKANQKPITNNHKPRTKIENTREQSMQLLVSLGVDAQHASDWLDVRKSKGAKSLTKTVISNIEKQAAIAGISFAEAIAICAKREWRGFDASWDWKSQVQRHPASPSGKQSIRESYAAQAAEARGEGKKGGADGTVIDGQCTVVR